MEKPKWVCPKCGADDIMWTATVEGARAHSLTFKCMVCDVRTQELVTAEFFKNAEEKARQQVPK